MKLVLISLVVRQKNHKRDGDFKISPQWPNNDLPSQFFSFDRFERLSIISKLILLIIDFYVTRLYSPSYEFPRFQLICCDVNSEKHFIL